MAKKKKSSLTRRVDYMQRSVEEAKVLLAQPRTAENRDQWNRTRDGLWATGQRLEKLGQELQQACRDSVNRHLEETPNPSEEEDPY